MTADNEAENLRIIYKAIEDLVIELAIEYPQRGPADDRHDAIRVVLNHIPRHHETLWVIAVDPKILLGHRAAVGIMNIYLVTLSGGERPTIGPDCLVAV